MEPERNTTPAFMIIDGKVYVSGNFTPPVDMVFGEAQIISISVYTIFFIIGLTFNSISLHQLLVERFKKKVKNKMNLLLIHLAIADLMVILVQVPLEIGWTYTVSWLADDITCRFAVFFRIIGCYLTGFIMIVISLDRLSAILSPLTHRSQTKKTKMMLIVAWLAAPVCSLPQSYFFQLKQHPLQADYWQCTTIGSFQSETIEYLYFVFVFGLSWILPLLVMICCYLTIVIVIYRRSKFLTTASKEGKINDSGVFGKSKMNTVKITGILVIGFVLCWSPYNIMYVWHFIDKEGSSKTDYRFQKLLYTFACCNNCINPLLYRMVGKGWRMPRRVPQISFDKKTRRPSSSFTVSSRIRAASRSPHNRSPEMKLEVFAVLEK